MAHTESQSHPSPRCDTCAYVLPSAHASTGLRCGLKYFTSSVIARKFLRMDHYPEVKPDNACESWSLREAPTAASPESP